MEEYWTCTIDDWLEIESSATTFEQKNKILKDMLENVDVVVDFPFVTFWREILGCFPEAKVIFYEREVEDWFKSFLSTTDIGIRNEHKYPGSLDLLVQKFFKPKYYKIDMLWRNHFHNYWLGQMRPNDLDRSWWTVFPINLFSNIFLSQKSLEKLKYSCRISKLHAIRNYRMHNADVKLNCPRKNLIILEDLKSLNFGKFCEIIGIALPENCKNKSQDWPHLNKKSSYIADVFQGRDKGNKMVQMLDAEKESAENKIRAIWSILVIFIAILAVNKIL